MKNVPSELERKRTNLCRSVFVAIASVCILTTSSGQNIDNLKLKDYRPVSIFKVPVTIVQKAKYPAIETHAHAVRSEQAIAECVKAMDASGIEKVIILSGASGARFDTLVKWYSKYGNRFELWCGFDNTGYDKPGYGPAAVKELERCHKMGAKGVGELMYKGKGAPPSATSRPMMLPDDPREDLLFEKCAELKMPVNLHVSEDKWMYETMDSTNDGLINASSWRVNNENGTKSHEEMLDRLENTLKKTSQNNFCCCSPGKLLCRPLCFGKIF